MICKFVVGQRVVRKPGMAYKVDPEYAAAPKPPIQPVGSIYTIVDIVPCADFRIGLEFAEFPCFIRRSGVKVYWDHADYAPVHDLGFWIGQEAAERIKSGRGIKIKIQKPADDDRRGDVPVKERSRALDRA